MHRRFVLRRFQLVEKRVVGVCVFLWCTPLRGGGALPLYPACVLFSPRSGRRVAGPHTGGLRPQSPGLFGFHESATTYAGATSRELRRAPLPMSLGTRGV